MNNKNITMNSGLRMMALMLAKKKWKNSNDVDIWSDIWNTRTCFDESSSEWNRTTMDEKIALLKELINIKGFDILQLSMAMMEVGNSEYNKGIREIDLVMSMSNIIDYLLKTKDAVAGKKMDTENEDIWADIWSTRGCFQTTCSEWNSTTMDEKVELLKVLLNKKGFSTFGLSLVMMDEGNTRFNKDIAPLDLVMSMSQIIDYLLKEKTDIKQS